MVLRGGEVIIKTKPLPQYWGNGLKRKAKRRQQEAGRFGSEGGRGHRKDKTLVVNFPQGFDEGEADDLAAQKAGIGRESLRK